MTSVNNQESVSEVKEAS